MLTSISLSEFVILGGFCLSGGFSSRKPGVSFIVELSLSCTRRYIFLCNSRVAVQGLAKAGLCRGGFSGDGRGIGQRRVRWES